MLASMLSVEDNPGDVGRVTDGGDKMNELKIA